MVRRHVVVGGGSGTVGVGLVHAKAIEVTLALKVDRAVLSGFGVLRQRCLFEVEVHGDRGTYHICRAPAFVHVGL